MFDGLRRRRRFRRLARLVAAPVDLSPAQWRGLYGEAVAVAPDLLVEVGRGHGNSTVVLTEAAHRLGARVLSIGEDGLNAWRTSTRPRLEPVVGAAWFAPLTVVEDRAESVDLAPWLAGSRRAFLFWDAHTLELARHLLAEVVPLLPAGSRVVLHDVTGGDDPKAPPVPYHYRQFRSEYEELVPLGEYLDARGLPLEDLGEMVAFTLPAR